MLSPEVEVTRLLSNLYKSQFVTGKENKPRVINSNDKVAAYMADYIRLKREEALAEGGFVEGIVAESVEVVSDENEIESLEEIADKQEKADRILDAAKEEANQIVEEAKLQAEHMREVALAEGRQSGYEEGKSEALAEAEGERQNLEEQKRILAEDYEKKERELEPQLVEVITDVVEKVFLVQFSDKKEIIQYLIQNTILNTDGCREFRIHVGEDSYPYVSAHKAELIERVGKDLRLDIIEDAALTENQCMIETEAGVFDCGVGVQMENLMKELKSLSL